MTIRALIIDYDKDTRRKLHSFLSNRGYAVWTASGVSEALNISQNIPCDVVICETFFEDGSAFDLISNLNNMGSTARFIVMTPRGDLKSVLDALGAGVYDILKKPFSENELEIAVKNAAGDVISSEKIEIKRVQAGWVEVQIPSLESSMRRLDRFFKLMYEDYVAPEVLEDISVCFREIVRNAIEWGHKFDVNKPVKISHMLHHDEFLIKIDDDGDGFEIKNIIEDSRDLTKVQDDRENGGIRPGGMGMTIVNGLMDQVLRNQKGNSIILAKKTRIVAPSQS